MQGGMDVDLPAVGEATSTQGAQPEEELYCLFILCQLIADKKSYDLVSLANAFCLGVCATCAAPCESKHGSSDFHR